MKIIFMLIAAFLLFTCQEEPVQNTGSPAGSTNASGDTIIYFRSPGVTFFSLPSCPGYYACVPADCIDIDCNTGKLFATSCSAVPYPLKCISDSTASDIVVLISGVIYPGGTVCSATGKSITPYYNGITEGDIPQGSKFDTPPKGEPSAQSQGLAINVCTGVIDVDESVANGIFGTPPQHGKQHTFRIYYRLNDNSDYTINQTDITFVYESATASSRNNNAMDGPGSGSVVIVKSCP